MKSLKLLALILTAAIFPIAALTSCKEDGAKTLGTKPAGEAKYHYAIAMTGVV